MIHALRSRRHVLRTLAAAPLALAGAALLAACGTTGATAPATTAPAATAAAPPTTTRSTAATSTSATATSTAAVAPASPTAAPQAAGTKTPLVWYHSFSSDQTPRLNSILVPDVTRDLPSIDLKITPTKGAYTDLQILIAGGSQPDVAMEQGLDPLGMFEDPSRYIARDKFDLSPYPPALLEFLKWKGTLWSLPASIGGNGPVFVYNKTRFQNGGVPEPPDTWNDPSWTWDELIKRTKSLTTTQGGGTTYGFGPIWAYFAHPRSWATQWMKLDLETVTADTPEMLQAFTVWQDMYCKYGVLPKPGEKPGYNTTQDPILAGTSAIKPTGAGSFSSYLSAPQVAWAIAPVPKGSVTAGDQNYYAVGIVTGTKHPDEAWAFAHWLALTPDYTLVRQVPPALPATFATWVPAVFGDQAVARRAHLIQEGIAFAQTSDGLVHHPKQQQMLGVLDPLVEKLSTCQLTPADLLRQAQSQLTAIAKA